MRTILIAASMVLGLGLLGAGQARAADTIKVHFENGTDQKVTFFLNGGKGLETRLEAGDSSDYTMVVDDGGTPTVRIYQPEGGGKPKEFTVENGGQYVFRLKDGHIINTFK